MVKVESGEVVRGEGVVEAVAEERVEAVSCGGMLVITVIPT